MERFIEYSAESWREILDEAFLIDWKILYHSHKKKSHKIPLSSSKNYLENIDKLSRRYVMHRRSDWNEPLSHESTLSEDLGSLTAEIAMPGVLDLSSCQDIAGEMAACLMQVEGCDYRDAVTGETNFLAAIMNMEIDAHTQTYQVAKHFSSLLQSSFVFTGDFMDSRLDKVREWKHFTRGDNVHETVKELVQFKG